jgi:thiamine-phosphate pyrophosphorylase
MTDGGIAALPPLNAIVDQQAAARAGWSMLDLADAFLSGGARFLQLRAKDAGSGWFLDLAAAVVERARQAGARVVINDRADIARLSAADGVHVGQDDLSPGAVRRLVGDQALVGLSTHTVEQIAAAVEQPIGYLAIGPVFGTSTKATRYDAVGLERVRLAATRAGARPVVAIGGITLDRALSVLAAGAASVAVIGDLLSSGDPEARVRAYVARLAGLAMYNPTQPGP